MKFDFQETVRALSKIPTNELALLFEEAETDKILERIKCFAGLLTKREKELLPKVTPFVMKKAIKDAYLSSVPF